MNFDTAHMSQALNDRLNYLGQKKSDLDMCSPVPRSPDDPIYERHARTPVKDKPVSRTVTPDIKVSAKTEVLVTFCVLSLELKVPRCHI